MKILTIFFSILFLTTACQPQTRQDRATVGPEASPPPVDPSTASPVAAIPTADGVDASGAGAADWEQEQKAQCDQGKPAGCSALAYEAVRAQDLSTAVQYFSRACLMNDLAAQCAKGGSDARGLSRSCYELSGIYQKQGRSEESRQFKSCACERGYKPACVL